MKTPDGYNKLRGGYYTPLAISRFITDWAICSKSDCILEPSCGDGSFIETSKNRLKYLGASDIQIYDQMTGVELDAREALKGGNSGARIVVGDFFAYYRDEIDGKKAYDVVVGNPPFIRYQNFDEDYRSVAFKLMKKYGFHPNRLTNIWLPFLALSCFALKADGRLGMVIPAELFQVDYAAEARLFLSTFFDRLTLITFKKLVFDGIQQEVVLLLGERSSEQKGIRILELNGLDDLVGMGMECLNRAETKMMDCSKEKWIQYYLTGEELSLLKKLSADNRITPATDLYEVNVGLVSGENDFFLLNKDAVKKNKIKKIVVPIIGKAEQVKGIILNDEDYDSLADSGKKVFFFQPGDVPFEQLSSESQAYIQWGEKMGYHHNYKCRTRKRWYHVSQSWIADAFLIRQANLYPKMIINKKHALVTDTLHKVRFLDGVNGETVAAAFLNTYTLALCETLGRSYGGGVLTFEPGEMRKVRIPMLNAEELDVDKIDVWQRDGRYEAILEYSDKILLKEGLGLSNREIVMLHSIWEKMRDRRLGRKNMRNL